MNEAWHKNIGCMGAWPLVKKLLGMVPGYKVMDPPPSQAGRTARAAWEAGIVERAREAAETVRPLWYAKKVKQFHALGDRVIGELILHDRIDAQLDMFEGVEAAFYRGPQSGDLEFLANIRRAELALLDRGQNPWDVGTCAGAAMYFVALAEQEQKGPAFESSYVQACVFMALINAYAATGKNITSIEEKLRGEVLYQEKMLKDCENEALRVYLKHPSEHAEKLLRKVEAEFHEVVGPIEIEMEYKGDEVFDLTVEINMARGDNHIPVYGPTREHPIAPVKAKSKAPNSGDFSSRVKADPDLLNKLFAQLFPLSGGPDLMIECETEQEAQELGRYIQAQQPHTKEEAEELAKRWKARRAGKTLRDFDA